MSRDGLPLRSLRETLNITCNPFSKLAIHKKKRKKNSLVVYTCIALYPGQAHPSSHVMHKKALGHGSQCLGSEVHHKTAAHRQSIKTIAMVVVALTTLTPRPSLFLHTTLNYWDKHD